MDNKPHNWLAINTLPSRLRRLGLLGSRCLGWDRPGWAQLVSAKLVVARRGLARLGLARLGLALLASGLAGEIGVADWRPSTWPIRLAWLPGVAQKPPSLDGRPRCFAHLADQIGRLPQWRAECN